MYIDKVTYVYLDEQQKRGLRIVCYPRRIEVTLFRSHQDTITILGDIPPINLYENKMDTRQEQRNARNLMTDRLVQEARDEALFQVVRWLFVHYPALDKQFPNLVDNTLWWNRIVEARERIGKVVDQSEVTE
jgi:hypothetical protein